MAWQVLTGAAFASMDALCDQTASCCCAEAPAPETTSCCAEPEPTSRLAPLPPCACPHLLSPEGGADVAVLAPGGSHTPQRLLVQTLDESVQALDGACPRAHRPAGTALGDAPPGRAPPLWQVHRSILR